MDTRTLLPTSLILALGALAPSALLQQDAPAPKPGELKRIDPIPVPAHDDEDSVQRVFGREFDRERWRARLETTDLDAREGAYDDLLRRARIDPVARTFVEELARDELHPELAWTARLALRELGPGGMSRARLFPESAVLPGMDRQLEALLEEMLGQRPELHALLLPRGDPFALGPPSGTGSTYGMQVVETPEGARIVITDRGQTREYSGESLEAILELHPELRERMHVSVERSRPIRTDKLGVRVVPVSSARAEELGLAPGEGLTVLSTHPGTIATQLGVQSGDVLLEMNGEPLRHPDEITARLESGAGRTLTLVWVDDLGIRQQRSWP